MASQLFICSSTSSEFEEVTLLASKDNLGPYIFSAQSQALFAQKPGRDVTFTRNIIQPRHIESCRQSYINAILIQSRGTALKKACNRCLDKSATGRKRNIVKRFTDCRVAKGHFDGCCANCKWSDAGMKCSHVSQGEPEDGEGHEGMKDDVTKDEGKGIEVESEDGIEEQRIQYESVTNESNGGEETAEREEEEENEILRKLLLPDFNYSSSEEVKRLATPDIEEESYSSEEEWQGFSP